MTSRGAPDPCVLVTRQEAATTLGAPVGEPRRVTTPTAVACGYSSADSRRTLTLSAYHMQVDPATVTEGHDPDESPDWKPERGLGDWARSVTAGNVTQFNVIRGRTGVMLQIAIVGAAAGSMHDRGRAVVERALERLP